MKRVVYAREGIEELEGSKSQKGMFAFRSVKPRQPVKNAASNKGKSAFASSIAKPRAAPSDERNRSASPELDLPYTPTKKQAELQCPSAPHKKYPNKLQDSKTEARGRAKILARFSGVCAVHPKVSGRIPDLWRCLQKESREDDGLSKYEKERLERIKANERTLRDLGIAKLANAARSAPGKVPSKSTASKKRR
jgi:hypothetical protein